MEDCRTGHHVPCFVDGGLQREKGKKDGVAAALFILVNIGIGFLPCAVWVRYGVSAFAIMGYASVLSGLYSGKPLCLNFHQTALSAVNDATASPPFSALLMKIYPAEFRQI